MVHSNFTRPRPRAIDENERLLEAACAVLQPCVFPGRGVYNFFQRFGYWRDRASFNLFKSSEGSQFKVYAVTVGDFVFLDGTVFFPRGVKRSDLAPLGPNALSRLPKSFRPRWIGPFEITRCISTLVYRIKPCPEMPYTSVANVPRIVHSRYLRRYSIDPEHPESAQFRIPDSQSADLPSRSILPDAPLPLRPSQSPANSPPSQPVDLLQDLQPETRVHRFIPPRH